MAIDYVGAGAIVDEESQRRFLDRLNMLTAPQIAQVTVPELLLLGEGQQDDILDFTLKGAGPDEEVRVVIVGWIDRNDDPGKKYLFYGWITGPDEQKDKTWLVIFQFDFCEGGLCAVGTQTEIAKYTPDHVLMEEILSRTRDRYGNIHTGP